MFINKYPYTDIHELNLNWILGQMLQLRTDMKDFVNQNTIKYADPIQWNITTQYQANTVVIDPASENAYISTQPVPAGVAISDSDYWSVIGNFSLLYESIKAAITDLDEENGTYASEDISKDKIFWLNNVLYRALIDIPTGTVFVNSGDLANIKEVTVEELLDESREHIEDVQETVMSSIASISGIVEEMKYYVLPQDFGAVGDGSTDDSVAFQSAVNAGKIVYIPAGTYKITQSIILPSDITIIGSKEATIINHIIIASDIEKYPAVFKADNKSNIHIEGVNIKGYSESISGGGLINRCDINFNKCANIEIINCSFLWSDTMFVIRIIESDNILIDGIYINHFHYIGVSFLLPSKHGKIINSTIKNCDNTTYNANGQCYYIDANGFETPLTGSETMNTDIIIDNNSIISENPGTWEAINAHGGNNIKVTNNYIKNTYSGINCGSSSSLHFRIHDCEISGNSVELTTQNVTNTIKNNACIITGGDYIDVHDNVLINGGYAGSLHASFDDPTSILIQEGRRVYVHDNIIQGSRGNVFELKLDNIGVYIKNNIIEGLYWATPYGSLKAAVFNIHNSTLLRNIYIEDNKLTNYELNDWLVFGKAGATPEAAYGYTDSYIRVVNNELEIPRTLVNQSADNIVTDQDSISNVKMGHVGDVILKKTQQAGTSLGWICTKKFVSGVNGYWSPLPNA